MLRQEHIGLEHDCSTPRNNTTVGSEMAGEKTQVERPGSPAASYGTEKWVGRQVSAGYPIYVGVRS